MQTKGTIAVGGDHAGFEMKTEIVSFLKSEGYEVVDHGSYKKDDKDDYPDFVKKVARDVSRNPNKLKGIVFGGTGTGEAIVCNRFPSVRAVSYYGGNVEIISLSREHNDANVLSLGARFVDLNESKAVIQKWLTIPFLNDERHIRRLEKIDNLYEDL